MKRLLLPGNIKNMIKRLQLSVFLLLLLTRGYAQPDTSLVRFRNSPAIWSPKTYSQAALIDLGKATLVIISGQIPFDQQGNLVGPGDMGLQTEQVFRNIRTVLAEAGGNLDHLVKIGIFLSDMSKLNAFRDVRNKFINPERPPASTLVEVSRLFRDDVMLEVEATAIIPKK